MTTLEQEFWNHLSTVDHSIEITNFLSYSHAEKFRLKLIRSFVGLKFLKLTSHSKIKPEFPPPGDFISCSYSNPIDRDCPPVWLLQFEERITPFSKTLLVMERDLFHKTYLLIRRPGLLFDSYLEHFDHWLMERTEIKIKEKSLERYLTQALLR